MQFAHSLCLILSVFAINSSPQIYSQNPYICVGKVACPNTDDILWRIKTNKLYAAIKMNFQICSCFLDMSISVVKKAFLEDKHCKDKNFAKKPWILSLYNTIWNFKVLPEILFEVGSLRSRVRNKRKKEMLRSPETDEMKVIGEL